MKAKSASHSRRSCRMGTESASYRRLRHRKEANSGFYNRIRSGMASESASYRKMQQNTRKIKEREGLAKGGQGDAKGWPGGRCDGRILRFAEAGTDSAFGYFCFVLSTRRSPQGAGRIQLLRASRRAHLKITKVEE